MDQAQIQDRASALIDDPAAGSVLDTGGGDVDMAFASAASTIEAVFTTATDPVAFRVGPLTSAGRNARVTADDTGGVVR